MTQVDSDLILLPVNQEELEAIADLLHGRTQIRMDSNNKWTGLKHIDLRIRVDAELALSKAAPFIVTNPLKPRKKKS